MNTPEPPVPADLDLRDLPYLPLDTRRLRDSALAATQDAEGFRAAVLLWCAAWHQVPAASLPDDDAQLAHLAGFGRDLRSWKRVRQTALHGFVLCADQRWYHPVVAEKAIEAGDRRDQFRARRTRDADRLRAWRTAKQEQAGQPDSTGTPSQPDGNNAETSTGNAGETPSGNAGETRFNDVSSHDETPVKPVVSVSVSVSKEARFARRARAHVREGEPAAGTMWRTLHDAGIRAGTEDPRLIAWTELGVTEATVLAAIALARERKPEPARIPLGYLDPIVRDLAQGHAHDQSDRRGQPGRTSRCASAADAAAADRQRFEQRRRNGTPVDGVAQRVD